jgi:hypothetical protein
MQNAWLGMTGGAVLLLGALEGCDAQVDPDYQGEPLVTLKGRVEALQIGAPEADVGVLWLTSDAENGCSGPQRSCITGSSGSYSGDQDQACLDACGDLPFACDPEANEEWARCQRACGSDVKVTTLVEYNACASGAVGQTAPVVGNFPAQFSLDMLLPPPSQAFMPSDTGERVALGYFVALAPHSGPFTLSVGEGPPNWLLGGSETHVLVYAADPIAADSSWGVYLSGAYPVGYHLIRVEFGNRCGLPEYYEEDFDDEPDSAGSTAVGLGPMPDTEPMKDGGESAADPDLPPELPSEPDYAGLTLVCGNGVCEPHETCEVCSDCGGCEDGSAGTSTGLLNVDLGYYCQSTPPTLVAVAPGGEAGLRLVIAPPGLIQWPQL